MRYSIKLLTTIFAAASLAACTDIMPDNGRGVDDDSCLSAVKVAQSLSRSVPPNTYFNVGTQYRLWAYRNNGGNNGEYLFLQEHGNGEIGDERSSHFIGMDSDANALLRGDVNIYGFTDGTKTAPTPDEGSTVDKPTFTISYNHLEPKAGSVENYIYPDYMRAKVNHNSNSSMPYSTLEFRHVMSQISVQVVQQDKEGNELQPESRYDIRVKDIAVKGLYESASYDVIDDKLILNTTGGEQTYTIWKSAETNGNEVGITPTELARTLIMPTVDESVQKGITLELTIEGNDVGQFLGNNEQSGKIEVPVLDNKNNQGTGTPLKFAPNFRYILQVAFIGGEVRVVTLVPLVYPWFDGETSSNDGEEWYQDKELSSTALFDNLLWSTLSIGAEVANPQNTKDFERAMGFFYQFDRNIPYSPILNSDGTVKDIYNNPSVYPVLLNGNGNAVNTKYAPVPANDNGSYSGTYLETLDNLYQDLIETDRNENNKTPKFGKAWTRPNTALLWNEIRNQPPPPGWRLPTAQDFLTIMPSTPHAGNITFLNNLRYKGPGKIGGVTNNVDTMENVDVIYIHVPNNTKYPSYPSKEAYSVNDATENPSKYTSEPESEHVIQNNVGDPAPNYASEYVISKRNGAKDFVGKPNVLLQTYRGHDFRWGCIYGIKKVGTSEAYRMRWHIESVGNSNENKYVLVVERYAATSTDRLLYKTGDIKNPHYYMNYDWDHPNTVLYFPLCGLVGSGLNNGAWMSGKLANVGTETIYATKDKASEVTFLHLPGTAGDGRATLRIKIAGDGQRNQFIHLSIDPDANGAQIRSVRDYDMSRNR